jgi:hypothetical protein
MQQSKTRFTEFMISMKLFLPPSLHIAHHLPTLEQEVYVLAHLKGDKAPGVVVQAVRNFSSNKAMPTPIVLLVKFSFYIPSNFLKKRQCNNFRKLIINQPTNKPTKHITSMYWHTANFLYFCSPRFAQSTAYCCISYGISDCRISALHPDILLELQQ